MTYDQIFSVANLGVLPAWLLLIFLPKAGITKKLVHSFLYPAIYGILYTTLFANAIFFGAGTEGGGFGSIPAVSAIFDHPNGVILGWSHYLVFDLFVGAWIARDSQRLGINHFLTIPCLFFTFMAGPFGLLLYIPIRHFVGKGDLSLSEA
jgi:hypothetical protein